MATLVNILQGHLTQAEFDAIPTFILGDGQIVWLKDNSGNFKKGDGVSALSVLPFLGSQNLDQVVTNGGIVNGSDNVTPIFEIDKSNDLINVKVPTYFHQRPIILGEAVAKVMTLDIGNRLVSTGINTADLQTIGGALKQEVKLAENITKGQAVYISSANGTNIIVSKASNATEATSSKTLGLLETTGVTNAIVKVITEGTLAGLDTSTATIGDAVWLGVSGNLIFGLASKPVAPAHLVYIGVVSRVHATVGEILVKVQNGFELNEIHDVLTSANVTTPVNTDAVLIKETSSGLWKSLSWLNIKATLKTYFDTLYGTIKGTLPATSGQIGYSNGTLNTITSSSDLTFNSNKLQVGAGTPLVSQNFNIVDSISGLASAVGFTVTNTSTTGAVSNNIGESLNNRLALARYGSTSSQVVTGTSLNYQNSSAILSVTGGSIGVGNLYIQGTPIINLTGGTSTNTSTRTDAVGHRIDTLANAHTTNLNRFTVNGNSYLGGNSTATAVLHLDASTTTRASLRLNNGVAPTSPNNGDIWFDGTDLKMRIGGVTKTFTLI